MSFDRHRFGEISRAVNVTAERERGFVSKQLRENDGRERRQRLRLIGKNERNVGILVPVFKIAAADENDKSTPRADFADVSRRLQSFVYEEVFLFPAQVSNYFFHFRVEVTAYVYSSFIYGYAP